MSVKTRKAEQYEHTRRLLLDTARRLFAARGFAGAGTEEVVREAGVTRGALYYHFKDKRDLFRAVVEDIQQALLLQVQTAAAAQADPWEGLRAGLGAFLDGCMDPAVQRIVLLDAPSVLGWALWRELDTKYGVGLLRSVLQALMDGGILDRQPMEPLAHMLLGALSEGGLLIAGADDPDAVRRDVGLSLDRLLRGLRAPA